MVGGGAQRKTSNKRPMTMPSGAGSNAHALGRPPTLQDSPQTKRNKTADGGSAEASAKHAAALIVARKAKRAEAERQRRARIKAEKIKAASKHVPDQKPTPAPKKSPPQKERPRPKPAPAQHEAPHPTLPEPAQWLHCQRCPRRFKLRSSLQDHIKVELRIPHPL